MNVIAALLSASSFLVYPAAATESQLIRNGDFERPAVGGYDYRLVDESNQFLLEGWNLIAPRVGVKVYGTTFSRNQYQALGLNGDDKSGIAQSFYPGRLHSKVTITWRHAQNPYQYEGCPTAPTQSYDASVKDTTGRIVASDVYEPVGGPGNWAAAKALTFDVTDNHYTLTYASRTNGVCGAVVTDVIVDEYHP
ncbi:hypothetical protein [Embleya hyalina]|uniref:hypothetical protein n=1 Tax=Embleya hyalina TaxID=516124 RepID=UPI000F834802|nr:hypothetical protein [Embleya hyalina]